ncbi:MAG TPA: UvrD-helicase domain-containing protein [Candidatus Limnocylindrales bacterium]
MSPNPRHGPGARNDHGRGWAVPEPVDGAWETHSGESGLGSGAPAMGRAADGGAMDRAPSGGLSAGSAFTGEEPPLPDEAPPEAFDGPRIEPPEPSPFEPEPVAMAERQAATEALAERILARLNPEQQRAVRTTDGPVLILAGAGSGKTRVLAHRVAYLIGVKGIRPWQILAVTFTNKAAAELRARIVGLVGEEAGREVAMGTFHALCARVLRREGVAIGLAPHFVVYDTDDQGALMKQILREEDLPITGEYKPSAILGAISRAKNEMLDADFVAANAHTHREREIARLYRRYQARLKAAAALDFDDLLLEAVRLFQDAPSVLERYQGRWRYLHVDEYQDTNRPQYLWVKALAASHHNLCVVGDDDQSIYSWRGADIRNILDFEGDYPDATVVKLEQNYRSTQLILDAAHALVTHNSSRKDKKLWTDNAGGRQIQRFEAYNEEEEAEWIARRVEELTGGRSSILTRRADEEAERWERGDVAVMYRTNAQSRAIEEAFLRYGIRYQLVGGTRFYQRREVKDALAYLRILRSDTDQVSFERILNVPARGLGEKTLEELRVAAAGGRTIRAGAEDEAVEAGAAGTRMAEPRAAERMAAGSSSAGPTYWSAIVDGAAGRLDGLGSRARSALGSFAALVGRLRTRIGVLPLPELLDAVMEDSGYRAMLADGSVEGEERWANLLELRSVTTRYDDLTPDDALDRFLEETALVADQDSYEAGADAVTLITLHAAKGLEFPVVFIAGLEEGVFPHSRSLDDEKQLEEERRLAYVGITRAKRLLFLSHAARRATWGSGGLSVPSRFLFEVPPGLMAGPRLERADDFDDDVGNIDPDLVFGRRLGSRFGTPIRAGGGAYRTGSGAAGGPRAGEVFKPTRDLGARREAYEAGARSGSLNVPRGLPLRPPAADSPTLPPSQPRPAPAARPRVPGERQFRDGDRIRHPRLGEGIVVTSKLTRNDEEVTVAFGNGGGVKTLLASIANLELIG